MLCLASRLDVSSRLGGLPIGDRMIHIIMTKRGGTDNPEALLPLARPSIGMRINASIAGFNADRQLNTKNMSEDHSREPERRDEPKSVAFPPRGT